MSDLTASEIYQLIYQLPKHSRIVHFVKQLEHELSQAKALLSTERDAFGKRETELMSSLAQAQERERKYLNVLEKAAKGYYTNTDPSLLRCDAKEALRTEEGK